MSFISVKRSEGLNAAAPPSAEVSPSQALNADISARVKREVARLRAQAEAEGRQHGERQGRAAARAETQAALQSAVSAFQQARRQLEAPLAALEDSIAEMVVDLAFLLARHIIGVEVKAGNAGVRALVAQLVREAEAERSPGQSIVVRLHPDDEKTMETQDRPENTRIIADATISRGGAVVEIILPEGDPIEKIEWDATIEARLAALRDSLALRDDGGAAR